MTPLRRVLVVLAVAAAVARRLLAVPRELDARLPLLVSALAVLAISLGILGFALAGTAIRVAEFGPRRHGCLTAFVGGLCVLFAAGALAGAIVLGILAAASWQPTAGAGKLIARPHRLEA